MAQRSTWALLLHFAAGLLSLPASASADAGGCVFSAAPTTLLREGDPHQPGSRQLDVWTIEDRPALWETAPGALLAQFRSQVAKRSIVTDREALLRQTGAPNNVLLAKNLSWIRPIRCLEALLFARQNERIPVLDRSTEFAAFILRSADGARLKIYNYTRNEDGIGNVSVLTAPIAKDVSDGWMLEASLHNHNFHPGEPGTNGIVSPSGPDTTFYRNTAVELGLREAWITNGMDTSHIPASAFPMLSTEHDLGVTKRR